MRLSNFEADSLLGDVVTGVAGAVVLAFAVTESVAGAGDAGEIGAREPGFRTRLSDWAEVPASRSSLKGGLGWLFAGVTCWALFRIGAPIRIS